jgi:hypothetical protein
MRSFKNGATLQQRATSTLCDRIQTHRSTDEDQDEFVDLIEDIVQNPDDLKSFRTDVPKKAFWDDATDTVVIFNPADPDLGTAFPPDDGYQFFLDLGN